MNSIQQQYVELAALTRRYLLQEHNPEERLYSDAATYTYFREYAARRAASATVQLTPAPVQQKENILKPPSPVPAAQPAERAAAAPTILQTPKPQIKVAATHKEVPQQAPPSQKKASPEIAEPESGKTSKTNALFTPDPSSTFETADCTEIRKILSERQPSLKFIDKIPNDAEAKKIARSWEQQQVVPHVLLLSFDESHKQATFLENLRLAIETLGVSAKVLNAARIENGKGWEFFLKSKELHLVIASSCHIDTSPQLKKFYKETTKQPRHALCDTPLFLLPDIASYLKEPSLKPLLWRALKDLIASPSSAI